MTQRKRVPSGIIVPAYLQGNLQIFELKQLADLEAAYKNQCKRAIQDYKIWRLKHKSETDIIELLYGNLEGIMLRRRAEDAIHMYWVVRQDFRKSFKEYLEKSCCYPSSFSSSKVA